MAAWLHQDRLPKEFQPWSESFTVRSSVEGVWIMPVSWCSPTKLPSCSQLPQSQGRSMQMVIGLSKHKDYLLLGFRAPVSTEAACLKFFRRDLSRADSFIYSGSLLSSSLFCMGERIFYRRSLGEYGNNIIRGELSLPQTISSLSQPRKLPHQNVMHSTVTEDLHWV